MKALDYILVKENVEDEEFRAFYQTDKVLSPLGLKYKSILD